MKVNADAVYVHTYAIAFCIRVYTTYYIGYTSLATCPRSLEYIHSGFISGHELVSLDYNLYSICALTELLNASSDGTRWL